MFSGLESQQVVKYPNPEGLAPSVCCSSYLNVVAASSPLNPDEPLVPEVPLVPDKELVKLETVIC